MTAKKWLGTALQLAALPILINTAWAADAPKLTAAEKEKGKEITSNVAQVATVF